MPSELDGKALMKILKPMLGSYGKHFTPEQWKHWAGVLGGMGVTDLTDSVAWWMNNRDEFPPSPAALKSHAYDQVKKSRHQQRQLDEYQRLVDLAPTEAERLPPEQARLYCKYIMKEIIEKKNKAPEGANKLRWYEEKMEDYYDKK
ncbi:hypothetical protein CMI37_30255 [Candidatus Pacearchaeota archaeon]|nr:hypothetical protein [Candidatus Pacearchaeota archaeon]|tara:strand:+ start:172 stop:609 length:438 start_codon:yes stop_codon:yes gene_type:complete